MLSKTDYYCNNFEVFEEKTQNFDQPWSVQANNSPGAHSNQQMDCNVERAVGASVAPDGNWLQGLKHSKSPQKKYFRKTCWLC